MMQIVLIGIAAGAASAFLFASFASGSLLSIPLFYLAPLPILIVALGWSHVAGLVAAMVAALGLAAIFGGFVFLSFLLGVGLPAWWLGYLALLARPAANGSGGAVEWYPIGRLLMWSAVIAGAVVSLVMVTIATDLDSLRAVLGKAFEPLAREGAFARVLIEHPHRVLPPAAAVLTTIVTVFMLWLAARVVRISGRLRRPWPEIAALSLPRFLLPSLIGASVASFILPDMLGVVATIFAASLLTAFGLLGLAVLHVLTRPLNGRGFVLGSVYGAIAIFGWPMLLMAMLGVADVALDLRARTSGRPPPPSNPHNG
jgi:hypothetical protein